MEPFLGQIVMFAGNFAPRGWAFCDGQLLPISQNSALFSILGTTYGGDGRTTFALPDLRGRVPVHQGNGPGLSDRRLGSKGGAETVTLNTNQIPSHNHSLNISNNNHGQKPNSSQVLGPSAFDDDPSVTLKSSSIGNSGGGQPHNNMQPFGCVNFIIALQGTFPSRS